MTITGLIEHIKAKRPEQSFWALQKDVVQYVKEPYTAQLLEAQMRIAALDEAEEKFDVNEVIARIQMIERKTRNFRKVERYKRLSIKGRTMADYDSAVRRVKASLAKVLRKVYSKLAKRIKSMSHNAEWLLSLREASMPALQWSDEVIGDALDGLPKDLRYALEKEMIKEFKASMKGLGVGLSIKFESELINQAAKDWVESHFYEEGLLVDLSESMQARIASQMGNLFDEGFSIDDMVDELGKTSAFSEMEDYALERIARTESRIAQNQGALEAAKEANAQGLDMVAVFLISGDACDVCQDIAAGNPYELDEAGDEPHPNCRDSWAFITRGDAEGEEIGEEE